VRVAHLGSKGIPSRGGTERVVEAVARRQAGSHRVTVYGSRHVCPGGWVGEVRVVALSVPGAKHLGPLILQLGAALHALVCGRYDLAHVHGSENGFIVPLLRLRYPVVTTNHGPAYERAKWGGVARRLIRSVESWSVKSATVATAVAQTQAEQLSARYGRDVRFIPNGIEPEEPDIDEAAELLGRVGLRSREFVLFAAARVDPTKGCHTLVEACAALDDSPPLLVVGDLGHASGYEERLRRLAEGLPVRFVPRLDDKATVLGLLALARCFVFPSTVEAMSMMLLEALSVGAPTLASDIPENTSVLPPDWPVFRAGDSEDLARGLRELLERPAEELQDLSTRGREWVSSRFDWDDIAAAYERVYEEAVASARRA